MSSLAEIEVAGVPVWLAEDSTATATAAMTTATPDNGDANWLADDSPATATTTIAIPDQVIYAPSRAATATGDSSTYQTSKTASNKKTKTIELFKMKRKNKNNGNISSPSDVESGCVVEDSLTPATTTTATTTNSPLKGDVNVNVNNGNDNDNDNNTFSNAGAASQKTWGQYFRESFKRDGRLLLITIIILICMNIPFVGFVLYPFYIFCTWIHEFCHGMAAILLGGSVSKLEIFPDGSGFAHTTIPNFNRRWFVSSAGYQGTAIFGFFLLIFRRTKRGPRSGTMILACMMLLTCVLWIRNVFGFAFIFCMGLLLVGLAIKLPSTHIRNLYASLAMMTSLNAITAVRVLFGGQLIVNGEPIQSDAHVMAEIVGGTYLLWATFWLILAIALTIMGILFAIPGVDEVADFACCGICQDFGCFKLCNSPGQRLASRCYRRSGSENPSGRESDTEP
jgi:hypothetical protein